MSVKPWGLFDSPCGRFPKTDKTGIKPIIKPVHKMHKTNKTGRDSKETLVDFTSIYIGFIGFMCFVDWFYKRFYDGFMVLCSGHNYAL